MIAIAKFDGAFGEIEILQSRTTGSYIYLQGGCYQSEIDDDGVSLVPYVHAMYGLLRQSRARDVLMIGCGGGSLGTMLAKSAVKVTIVDNNPTSFRIARDYFSLPETIDCHVADGEKFLLTTRHCYDAIVMDAFDGDSIPQHLYTLDFFRVVQSHLDEECGCLLSNVHTMHDLDRTPDRYAATAKGVWTDVRLLDTCGVISRNALILAGNVRDLRKPTLLMPPQTDSEELAIDLNRMLFRSRRV